MHPAFSVIFFTAASGAGYGLLILVGVLNAVRLLPTDRWFGLAALALALGAVTFGLLSSTFHLGRPERAWRSFSQWRSSWLSREGVASVATFLPASVFALGWVGFSRTGGVWAGAGVVMAVLALATLYCTAMIYVSLKPIQRWSNGWVWPNYLLIGLMTGAIWLNAVAHVSGVAGSTLGWLAALFIIAGLAVKLGYWRFIDSSRAPSTAGTATGLGHLGTVRLFEAPHTQENYLLQEMGYRIARKHVVKLRLLAVLLGFLVPLLLLLPSLWRADLPLPGLTVAGAVLAAVSTSVGILIERWLFFAEAKHTITLYYGAARV